MAQGKAGYLARQARRKRMGTQRVHVAERRFADGHKPGHEARTQDIVSFFTEAIAGRTAQVARDAQQGCEHHNDGAAFHPDEDTHQH